MITIVFIAPPAAGKGLASSYIESKYKLSHISTGNILRASNDEEVKAILSRGDLISDDITNRLLTDYLSKEEIDNGFILDGYPRNLEQAKFLDNYLNQIEDLKLIAINLNVTKETALKRSLGRIFCPNCKRTYSSINPELQPKKENICDFCNTKLESRTDDNEESFNHRFDIYLEDTLPIINYYKEKGILYTVLSVDNVEEVYKQLDEVIEEALND